MKKLLVISIIAIIALSSCSTGRYFAGFKAEDAEREFALLGPISHQYYTDSHRNEFYSDSLSVLSENLICEIVPQVGVHVNCLLPLDSLQREEAEAFICYVAAHDVDKANDFPIPDVLDKLLEESGYRYGLLLLSEGMSHDAGEYLGRVAFGLGLGILTAIMTGGLFAVYAVPTPSMAVMYAAVLDSRTDRVVFFNLREYDTYNPVTYNNVKAQLSALLKKLRQ